MLEVTLKYQTDFGTEEIILTREKTSFGRGGEADYRIEDDGLSRLHASVFYEDGRIWIVDEHSTNGTFVNGQKVNPGGTPISDGDTIRIGHRTDITVTVDEVSVRPSEPDVAASVGAPNVVLAQSTETGPSLLIPLMVTGLALLVVCAAAIFIGVNVLGGSRSQPEVTRDRYDEDDFDDSAENSDEGNSTDTTPPPTNLDSSNTDDLLPNGNENIELTDTPVADDRDDPVSLPAGKKYQSMSDTERNQYIKFRAEKVARIIGNKSSDSIPPEAIDKIRRFLDAYASRIGRTKKNDCSGSGWLSSDMVSILERAKENAPFIIRAFNQKGIDPQVGLYLAMIESEHCPCLQSYTGPLGMFQFTYSTAKRFGLNVERNASPSNPDERCQPEPAARASASYMKSLTGRIGTGPLSIPLAIASYNSGEGGLGKNLRTALESNESQNRSFWTLVANAEKLAEQFQKENIKYVPKFFAAAIIGENPRDFGIAMQPLSTYTN